MSAASFFISAGSPSLKQRCHGVVPAGCRYLGWFNPDACASDSVTYLVILFLRFCRWNMKCIILKCGETLWNLTPDLPHLPSSIFHRRNLFEAGPQWNDRSLFEVRESLWFYERKMTCVMCVDSILLEFGPNGMKFFFLNKIVIHRIVKLTCLYRFILYTICRPSSFQSVGLKGIFNPFKLMITSKQPVLPHSFSPR